MPGYANWEQLYQEEFQAMTQEGFDTAEASRPESCARPLPFPGQPVTVQDQSSERFWKDAYERLWNIRNDGLRQNYPYVEPVTFEEILTQAAPSPELPPLTEEEYSVRIAGAVYGRIAGVVLGKPLEMSMDRKRIREYLESIGEYPLQDYVSGYSEKLNIRLREDCIPSTRGNIQYVQPDDDIHYTLLALLLAEKKGLNFTVSDVGENWLDNVPYNWFWCASRQAYYKMVNLDDSRPREEQISEIPWYLNPWRECIDGQIRCDGAGRSYTGRLFSIQRLFVQSGEKRLLWRHVCCRLYRRRLNRTPDSSPYPGRRVVRHTGAFPAGGSDPHGSAAV